jgi:putative FmdB family regulatory protein
MPTYDYVCRACGHRVEVHHGLYAEGPTQCPNCHSHALRKAIAAPAIVFKGSGWAKKDRSNVKSATAAGRDAAGGETGSSSNADGGEPSKGSEPAKGGEGPKGAETTRGAEPTRGTEPAKRGSGTTEAASASSGGSNPASGVD